MNTKVKYSDSVGCIICIYSLTVLFRMKKSQPSKAKVLAKVTVGAKWYRNILKSKDQISGGGEGQR